MVKMMKLFVVMLALVATSAEEFQGIAVLQNEGVTYGNVTFRQVDDGPVAITGTVVQLAPGNHGFHIHEKGDVSGGCMSAGGHFNPNKHNHGSQGDDIRHVGDLGNIIADANSVAQIELLDHMITLRPGPHSVLGRAVVVHSGEDDLGKGSADDSLTTGHAGPRFACGVIGVLSPTESWPVKENAANSTTDENAATCTTATLLTTILPAVAVTLLRI